MSSMPQTLGALVAASPETDAARRFVVAALTTADPAADAVNAAVGVSPLTALDAMLLGDRLAEALFEAHPALAHAFCLGMLTALHRRDAGGEMPDVTRTLIRWSVDSSSPPSAASSP